MSKTTPKAPRQAKSASASAVNAATAGQAASDGENAAARRARQFAEWLKTHPSGPNKAPRRSDDEVLAEARAKYYKGASTGPTTSPAAPALKISSQPEVREAKVEVGETPESAGLESLARELGVTVGALQEVTELLAARPGDIVTAAQQQLAINKVLEPSLNAHAEVKAKRYRAEIVAVANMHMDQILKGYAKLSKCLGEIEPLRAGLVAPLSSALSNTLLPLLKVKDGLALLAADVAVPAHRPRKAWLQTAAQELKRLGASHSEILLVLQNKNLVLPSYSTENVRDLLRPARERKPRGRIGKK